MPDEKILERVAKLLELGGEGRGGTEAERELATQRAHELMLKYNIEQSEIHGKSTESGVGSDGFDVEGSGSEWQKDLYILLGEVCYVKGFYIRKARFKWTVVQVGRPENIAFVRTLCANLIPQLEAEALIAFRKAKVEQKMARVIMYEEEYEGDIKPRSFKRAFFNSAIYTIRARLEIQRREAEAPSNSTDLVRNEDAANEQYLRDHGIHLESAQHRGYSSDAGHMHGQVAGAHADINVGRKLK